MTILRGRSISKTDTGISAALESDHNLHIDLLENWLIRVAIEPSGGFKVNRSWMIAPQENPPIEGNDRLISNLFSCPKFNSAKNSISTEKFRCLIGLDPLRLSFEQKIDGNWEAIATDRENGAYQWLERNNSFKHFQTIERTDRHFGLGDKAGPLDRTRKRFTCLQTDALGYDAELSDPLYKHAPFFLACQKDQPSVGILYDTFSQISFDFGSEHSNYFKPFRHVDARENGLVYYLILGPKISDIVPRLHKLTGMPAMPPRWSLGFAFTAMAHTDAPNAQEKILDFAKKMRADNLPTSAIHMGSGYTQRIDGKRYVFNWNLDKFPDRDGFFSSLKEMGYHTCANVKPVLLTEHQNFDEATNEGWFVTRENGKPAIERFWDGAGAQLDFTNPDAIKFWYDGITHQVLKPGFNGIWNDNNEAELWDETATVQGFGEKLNGMMMRPVHALQMTRTSHKAITDFAPDKRPYTISRAGPIGVSRYGETWSGDNETCWHSLKWNLRQGLSMSLSGFPVTGHDIGGFSGPSPSRELLVRWFQMMALHPRAIMNSWKPDEIQNTNLPYMYDEVVDLVRNALNLRYRFLPYIYALAYNCHKNAEPLIRPLFYDFADKACFDDQDTFMLGKDLLISPATEPSQERHNVYLPENEDGWFEIETGKIFNGGQHIQIDADIERLPLFARVDSIIPTATSWPKNAPHNADKISLLLLPGARKGEHMFAGIFDEGELNLKEHSATNFHLKWNEETVLLDYDDNLSIPVEFDLPTLGNRKFKTTKKESP